MLYTPVEGRGDHPLSSLCPPSVIAVFGSYPHLYPSSHLHIDPPSARQVSLPLAYPSSLTLFAPSSHLYPSALPSFLSLLSLISSLLPVTFIPHLSSALLSSISPISPISAISHPLTYMSLIRPTSTRDSPATNPHVDHVQITRAHDRHSPPPHIRLYPQIALRLDPPYPPCGRSAAARSPKCRSTRQLESPSPKMSSRPHRESLKAGIAIP